jgi:hypothetical protein
MAALWLVLSGCAPLVGPEWRGIIKVGVVAPYSGPATTNGLSLLAGAREAADELNRAGGVAGYRVEVVAPDELNPETPADLVADPDVVSVVGHLAGGWEKAASVYQRAGVTWLTAEPIDAGPGRLAMTASPGTVDSLVANYLSSSGQLPGSPGAVSDCRQAEARDGAVILVGAVVLACGLPSARLAATLETLPERTEVVCPAGCDDPTMARLARNVVLDAIAPVAPPKTDRAAWDHLAQALRDRTPVTAYAAIGYDGVRLVAAAAERAAPAGWPDRSEVAAELARTNQVGVLGAYGPRGPRRVTAELWQGDRLVASAVEVR